MLRPIVAVTLFGAAAVIGETPTKTGEENSIDKIFADLAANCFENRNCDRCADLFAKDATVVDSSVFGRHMNTTETDFIKENVFEACKALERYDKKHSTRTVLKAETSASHENVGAVLATIYQTPNILRFSAAKNEYSKNAMQGEWSSMAEHWQKLGQGSSKSGGFGKFQKIVTSEENSKIYDELLAKPSSNPNDGEQKAANKRNRFVADMAAVASKLFGSGNEAPILCQKSVAYTVKLSPKSNRIIYLSESNKVGDSSSCASPSIESENNNHSDYSYRSVVATLTSFWTDLSSGSCSTAVQFVSDTFKGVFGSMDVLETGPKTSVNSWGSRLTSMFSQLRLNKKTLMASCEKAKQLGLQLEMGDMFISKGQTSGVALLRVERGLAFPVLPWMDAITYRQVNKDDLPADSTHPTDSSKKYFPAVQPWEQLHQELVNFTVDDKPAANQEHTTPFNATKFCADVREVRQRVQDAVTVWKSTTDQVYDDSREFVESITSDAQKYLEHEAELISQDPQFIADMAQKISQWLSTEKNATLRDLGLAHFAFSGALEVVGLSIDTALDLFEKEAKKLDPQSDTYGKLVYRYGHFVEALRKFKTAVRKQMEQYEKDIHSEIQRYKDSVQEKGQNIIDDELNLAIQEFAANPSAEGLKKAPQLLTLFTATANGNIVELVSLSGRVHTNEDLHARLLGWPAMNNPTMTRQLTSAMIAILLFLPALAVVVAFTVLSRRRVMWKAVEMPFAPLISNGVLSRSDDPSGRQLLDYNSYQLM